ncbi:WxL domain-containing protein [Dolosigranulum pigrum]|uniref:WxL domain-containing protein n=1 Tax=Dolosigranulum pigrum TaxID=29394 RepID=UPI001AD873BD|nr:WxL domain-containing protein [Dolosigranulum pigrum]QTJ36946.1 WxL domain-containing protein [Dolosigranulum pigrum]
MQLSKLKKFLTASAVAGVLLGATTLAGDVYAVGSYNSNATITFTEPNDDVDVLDPTDPSKTLDPQPDEGKTGDTGPLTLDYVTNLDFGTHDVSIAEQTYTAKNDPQPFTQVTDRRGTSTGWTLTVQAASFQSGGEDTLPGASLTFENGTATSNLNGLNAPQVNSPINVTTGGNAVNVTIANAGQGRGTWITSWSKDNVKLTIPQGTATEGTHTSQLTWTLSDAPQ